jgi:hypothetical protein
LTHETSQSLCHEYSMLPSNPRLSESKPPSLPLSLSLFLSDHLGLAKLEHSRGDQGAHNAYIYPIYIYTYIYIYIYIYTYI